MLADEINRAPAKVQAALLEAMEERQVTVAGKTHKLPELFMVLATQNPIEQEGTYPLPEAQRDRFLLHIMVRYPSDPDELKVMHLVRDEAREDWQQAGRERRDSWQDYADDNGWDWDDDDWDDHPFATGMAVAAGASLTAAAFRAMTCPPAITVGGVPYYQCGGMWYSPAYQSENVTYIVVNPPPGY